LGGFSGQVSIQRRGVRTQYWIMESAAANGLALRLVLLQLLVFGTYLFINMSFSIC